MLIDFKPAADPIQELRDAFADLNTPVGNMDPDGRMKILQRNLRWQRAASAHAVKGLLDAYDALLAREAVPHPLDDDLEALAMQCCGDLRADRLCMTRDQRINFARKVLATFGGAGIEVSVGELRASDGITYCVNLWRAGCKDLTRAMCVLNTPIKENAEFEADEWREWLTGSVPESPTS